jgi:cysteine desulfurase
LRGAFLDELQAAAAPLAVNSPDLAVPHVVSIAFLSCRADVMMMNLDLAGIACSAGSACSSGSLLPSPVLQAMGIEQELLKSSLRFSFSCRTSVDEVRRAARCICEISNKLRRVPLCDV